MLPSVGGVGGVVGGAGEGVVVVSSVDILWGWWWNECGRPNAADDGDDDCDDDDCDNE
jgi:hypothetical protein